MALAIAAMHYLGMASMEMAATIKWDLPLVALSVVIGFAASLFALWLVMMIERERLHLGVGVRVAAAIILGFGVAGLHYTGMVAADFHATKIAAAAAGGSSIGSGWIIALLVVGAAVMLAVLVAGAAADQRRAALATDLWHVARLARDLGHMEGARSRTCAAVTEMTGADFAALLERDADGRPAVTATAGDPRGGPAEGDRPGRPGPDAADRRPGAGRPRRGARTGLLRRSRRTGRWPASASTRCWARPSSATAGPPGSSS